MVGKSLEDAQLLTLWLHAKRRWYMVKMLQLTRFRTLLHAYLQK
jgi:hypothetical protein